jgi:tRNA (cytidine/uridine-2'-O-)-methyltransferase
VHADFDAFLAAWRAREPDGALHVFTAHATRSYLDAGFRAGDALVFGKESTGLPDAFVAQYKERALGIPTAGAVRSLNLANAVSIATYEALRQTGALAATFSG